MKVKTSLKDYEIDKNFDLNLFLSILKKELIFMGYKAHIFNKHTVILNKRLKFQSNGWEQYFKKLKLLNKGKILFVLEGNRLDIILEIQILKWLIFYSLVMILPIIAIILSTSQINILTAISISLFIVSILVFFSFIKIKLFLRKIKRLLPELLGEFLRPVLHSVGKQ